MTFAQLSAFRDVLLYVSFVKKKKKHNDLTQFIHDPLRETKSNGEGKEKEEK